MKEQSNFEKIQRAITQNILASQKRLNENPVTIEKLKYEYEETLKLYKRLENFLSKNDKNAFSTHQQQWYSLNHRLIILYSLIGTEYLTGDAK